MGATKRTQRNVCALMCMHVGGIDGGERLKKRIRNGRKKEQFVSFCRYLHVLAGTFEGYRKGTPCTGTSEKDFHHCSVYLTDCCMVLKLLWPKYCFTI